MDFRFLCPLSEPHPYSYCGTPKSTLPLITLDIESFCPFPLFILKEDGATLPSLSSDSLKNPLY